MYAADLRHPAPGLEEKLHALYNLNRGTKLDLSFRPQYLNLLKAFSDPHKKLPPVIHVAGTNGKGSVIAMLRAALEEAGYKVHVYTSPHLYAFNERIRLAGKLIDDESLEQLIDGAIELNNGADVTFFEITSAMAFAAFSAVPADILLLETGLGGRMDCTNIIENPLLTIITPIAYDHMEYLGDTLKKIAAEKAGIIKQNIPCVTAQQQPDALKILQQKSAESGSELLFPLDHDITPNLTGPHQTENAAIACAALAAIFGRFPVSKNQMQNAFQKIEWPGRLEKLSDDPEIWYDGGHNEHAARAIAAQAAAWKEQDGKPLHLILGMKADKNAGAFINRLLPFAASSQIIPIPGVDSITAIPGAHSSSTLSRALANTGGKGRILVCGSLYLAAPLRDSLKALS
jgi:dihydrofolate synthase/folylpolyglutamate synthase